MSHLTTSMIVINDLDILKKAVAGFGGLRFNENVKTFRSYYCHERGNDSGRVLEDQIKAIGVLEHSISIDCGDGTKHYEIGVIRKKDGEGYVLSFDPYDTTAANKVGGQCQAVMAAYGEEFTRDWAAKNGFMVEQTYDDEGNLCLTMTQ